MKLKNYFFICTLLVFFSSCSEDDTANASEFVVAFENPSLSLLDTDVEKEIKIVFSAEAPQNGTFSVSFIENNLVYGEDFTTTPPATNGTIEIPITAGTTESIFSFQKITANPVEGENEKSVEFLISEIDLPNAFSQGNTSLLVSFSENASLGGSFSPTLGGPNEGNQVYVDLSTQTETVVPRDKWDLAFYSGEEFRVKLNNSLFMMAAELETTNIDEITEEDVTDLQPQMTFLVAGSDAFVDSPDGNIHETAISEISANSEENKVYLLKVGDEVGTNTAETGSVAISGEFRGWKKVRFLQENGNYKIQYADLNATTHQEFSIPKNENFNFTFFSFTTQNIVEVEPEKTKWDLNFTVFTEVLDLPEGGQSAYGFSDYVATNVLSETKAYQILTSEISYNNFSIENVNETSFQLDQRTIGANWRSVFEGLYNDRFYVIKDPEGNIYKLKFTALVNENGLRGYPQFEYSLLN